MRLFARRSSSFTQGTADGSVAASTTSTAPLSSITSDGTMKRLSRVNSVRNFLHKRFRGSTKKSGDAATLPDYDHHQHRTLEKSLSEGALPRIIPSSRDDMISRSPDRAEILERMRQQRTEIDTSIRNLKQRLTVIDHLDNMRRILASHESAALTERAARLVDLDDETPVAESVLMRCQQQRRDSGDYAEVAFSDCSNRSSVASADSDESRNSLDVSGELADILQRLNLALDTNREELVAESGYDSDSTRADSPNSARSSLCEPSTSDCDGGSSVNRCVTEQRLADEEEEDVSLDEKLSGDDLELTLPVSDDEEEEDEIESSERSRLDSGCESADEAKNLNRTCTIVEALTKDGRVVSECEILAGSEIEQQEQQQQQQQLTGMKKFQIRKQSAPTLASVVLEATASRKVFSVSLSKGDSRRLGFSIVGGADYAKGRNRAIAVRDILEGGEAQRNGQLRVGDEILAVNGLPMRGMTHDEAVRAFRSLKPGRVVVHVARK